MSHSFQSLLLFSHLKTFSTKNIKLLEDLQRAIKFILQDFTSDYKSQLIRLRILPLMMTLELYDINSFLKQLKWL